ncbi:MAG: HAMP domain-containing sensor histidine kinase [Acidimicrobiia bacterium]
MTLKETPVESDQMPAPPGPVSGTSKRSHLQSDIVGGVLTVTFLVLMAILVLGFIWQREVFQAAALERVTGVAAAQTERVEAYVAEGMNHAEMLAARSQIFRGLPGGEGGSGPAAVQRAIDEYVAIAHDVSWVSVYSADLELVASTDPSPVPVNADYLARGLRGTVAGNVIAGDGENLHLVGSGVGDPAHPRGVVLVAQSMARLNEMTRDFRGLGETGETTLARAVEGGVEFLTPLRFDSDAALSLVVPDSAVDVSVIRILNDGSLLADDGVDYRGVPVVAAGSLLEGVNWIISVELDRAEAMEPLDNLVRAGLAALIFGSVVAGALAWKLSQQIRLPILKIKNAALAIARGDRHTVVPNNRVDEIGELVDAFNMMTAELDSMTGSLEEKVEERTAQLEQKNSELREMMAAKETFLAGVSHEVRGPLTAMMGFIELARDDSIAMTEESGPMLQAAMQQADEVLILIEDLLAAARAESGTLKVARVRVNLQAQIAQVKEGLSPDQHDALDAYLTEAVALGDPARIRQIVRNLVSNAFRYGGDRVRIRTYSDAAGVVLVVEDDGAGIPAADRGQIFEPFVQSASRREVTDSVGIGLHVSRQLAELMSGKLDYRFEDGWSMFALTLPRFVED